MKNRIIRDRFAALSVLSQRTLPSSTAINKVTTLLTSRFRPANEVIDRRIKEELTELALPEGDERTQLPIALAESRQRRIDAVLDEAQVIKKIPDHMRLTFADLPKSLKGDEGWKNQDELAHIRVLLGALYIKGDDEKLADDLEGEEIDEATATVAIATSTDPLSTAHFEEA